jgi:predicted TPR repeat methyltransferase
MSRYDAIMQNIAHRRYRSIYEPGCSVGVLTSRLAAIGDRIDAMDLSMTAVQRARKRCQPFPHVHVSHGRLPEDLPDRKFDLIVFSEIGYYFPKELLFTLTTTLLDKLALGGTFIACHWLGFSPDHLLSGNEVHQVLNTVEGLKQESARCCSQFRMDRWGRI